MYPMQELLKLEIQLPQVVHFQVGPSSMDRVKEVGFDMN